MLKNILLATVFSSILMNCSFCIAQTEKGATEATDPKTKKVIKLPTSGFPSQWVQGNVEPQWEENKLYIIECFATWCGPCKAVMPHLQEIYDAVKNDSEVALFSICVMDRSATDETIKNVLKKNAKGKDLTYPVAIDVNNNTKKQWLDPLGVNGVPFVCAVRNGILLWRGHPVSLTPEFIKQMKDPNFNAGQAAPMPNVKKQRDIFIDKIARKEFKEAEKELRERNEKTRSFKRMKAAEIIPQWYSASLPAQISDETVEINVPKATEKRNEFPSAEEQKKFFTLLKELRQSYKTDDASYVALLDKEINDPALVGVYAAEIYYFKANLDFEKKNYSNGIKILTDCANRFSNSYECISMLQKIISQIEGLEEHSRDLNIFLINRMIKISGRTDPNYYAVCYQILSDIYEKMGRTEESLLYAQKAFNVCVETQFLKILLDGKTPKFPQQTEN